MTAFQVLKKAQPLLSIRLNLLAVAICTIIQKSAFALISSQILAGAKTTASNLCQKPECPKPTHLCPRPLAPDRQPHRMPPAPVRAHVSQPLDVLHQLAAQVVAQRHLRQLRAQVRDLLLLQRAHARIAVDVELRHQVLARLRSEAVEGFEGFRDEGAFREVSAEDVDLHEGEVLDGVGDG